MIKQVLPHLSAFKYIQRNVQSFTDAQIADTGIDQMQASIQTSSVDYSTSDYKSRQSKPS